jgi:hypothetical protein
MAEPVEFYCSIFCGIIDSTSRVRTCAPFFCHPPRQAQPQCNPGATYFRDCGELCWSHRSWGSLAGTREEERVQQAGTLMRDCQRFWIHRDRGWVEGRDRVCWTGGRGSTGATKVSDCLSMQIWLCTHRVGDGLCSTCSMQGANMVCRAAGTSLERVVGM